MGDTRPHGSPCPYCNSLLHNGVRCSDCGKDWPGAIPAEALTRFRADLARVTGERDEALLQIGALGVALDGSHGAQLDLMGKLKVEYDKVAALRAALETIVEQTKATFSRSLGFKTCPVCQFSEGRCRPLCPGEVARTALQAITTRATAGGGEAATPATVDAADNWGDVIDTLYRLARGGADSATCVALMELAGRIERRRS